MKKALFIALIVISSFFLVPQHVWARPCITTDPSTCDPPNPPPAPCQSTFFAAISSHPISPGKGYATSVADVINFALRVVYIVAVLLVFMYLILGGIEYITSGGDKGKTEGARNKITNGLIGLVILAASYALITLLLRFLGFSCFNDVFNNVPILSS